MYSYFSITSGVIFRFLNVMYYWNSPWRSYTCNKCNDMYSDS